jgi:probable HAF family extracellular repeat protein
MTDLGTLGGVQSYAVAVNNAVQAVGWSFMNTGEMEIVYHSLLCQDGVLTDLGTLGGTLSQAYSINDSGQVVGWSHTAGDTAEHAFLYTDGVMMDLGTLGGAVSRAMAVDNLGRVVGYSTTDNSDRRAFLYTSGTMIDINELLPANSGWTLLEASDINDAGWIVGKAVNPQGHTHAFLLMPEPAGLFFLVLGGLATGRCRDRVRRYGKSRLTVSCAAST